MGALMDKRRRIYVTDPERGDWDPKPAEVLERNGSLTYVERENGERDWVSSFEIERSE